MLSPADRNNQLRKRLAIWLLVNSVLLTLATIKTTTCFSTPRSDRNAIISMRATGGGRDIGTLDQRPLPTGNLYTANYITAIEDNYSCAKQSGGSGGSSGAQQQQAFFVATTDHNYAINSACLLDRGWRSVAVNGDQVFILTDDNRAFSTSLYSLDELQRDFIAEVRSNFTQNLAGLKFSRYTSGSSTHLPAARHAAPALGSSNGCTGPSIAASTIGRLVSGTSNSLSPGELIERRPISSAIPAGIAARSARSYQAHETAPTVTGAYCAMSQSTCTPGRLYGDTFNYYDLYNARLNTTLAGDIYFLDFYCNILDIYSSTVSVRQLPDMSVLYRDPNYFSVSRSNLPLAINRFFLVNEQVFFVYNDGSVLVKTNWQLDKTELDTVMHARDWLAATGKWQDKAANLAGRGARRLA